MAEGYIGKVSHAGTQKVQAPIRNDGKRGKTSSKKGDDLRTKKG